VTALTIGAELDPETEGALFRSGVGVEPLIIHGPLVTTALSEGECHRERVGVMGAEPIDPEPTAFLFVRCRHE
jgi:hypothetical protein